MTTSGTSVENKACLPRWDATRRALRVQIFGAGGAVGRELASLLLALGHPAERLTLFGRAAKRLAWRGGHLAVHPIPARPPDADLVFLCTPPELARRIARYLASRSVRTIDLSGGLRGDPGVPLVVRGINDGDVGAFTDLIALPGRSALLCALPLWEIEKAVGLAAVECVVLRSAASQGARGILALRNELAAAGPAGAPEAGLGSETRVGNVQIASEGAADGHGSVAIERELVHDIRSVLRRPDLPLDFTVVDVDVERCDSFAVTLSLRAPIDPRKAASLLAASPRIQVAAVAGGPTPRDTAGSDRIHVGRIRTGLRGPRSLCFFAVGDQLRAGAAVAALRVATLLPAGG